ncbi:hypothetical protein [Streptomyces sp. NPDC007984]|uniref:hypothetical protein n=1 Tax=Streptomyces sp. NPDC007984 TaxID=3364801 RepID=UPI0036E8B938
MRRAWAGRGPPLGRQGPIGPTAGRQERTAHVLTLRGELDLLAVPALRARLDVLTAGPCPDLVWTCAW